MKNVQHAKTKGTKRAKPTNGDAFAIDIQSSATAAKTRVVRMRVALDFLAEQLSLDEFQRDEYTEASIAAGSALADLANILNLVRVAASGGARTEARS